MALSLGACSKPAVPNCFTGSDTDHTKAEATALADARGRTAPCESSSEQCRFTAHTRPSGEVFVEEEIASVVDSKCYFSSDTNPKFLYSSSGEFREEIHMP